ncbi:MAG: SprT-like domain-containing protein [Bacteroidaceae bacterium]|nr:SprT-like domain-containing protein [Bacteroidaceae bacterium]MBP5731866.1 SprT-like domain-containing protein [Bacteroidaceae bacterium]
MRATLDFLQERYAQFNATMFGDELPQVRLRLSRARTYLGQLRYKRTRSLFGCAKYTDLTISVSTLYDLPEAEVEDTLIHEMIHLHILLGRQRDSSTHGTLFRAKMREINVQFGRHITVSHHATEQERQQDRRKRNHLLCVCTFVSGRQGIILARPSNISALWQRLPSLPDIENCRWYLSTDSYLNRYPRPLTLKIYSIPPETLTHIIAEARPLIRQNGYIFPARREEG